MNYYILFTALFAGAAFVAALLASAILGLLFALIGEIFGGLSPRYKKYVGRPLWKPCIIYGGVSLVVCCTLLAVFHPVSSISSGLYARDLAFLRYGYAISDMGDVYRLGECNREYRSKSAESGLSFTGSIECGPVTLEQGYVVDAKIEGDHVVLSQNGQEMQRLSVAGG